MRRRSFWRAAVVAAVVVMVGSSCQWTFARFDAANTGASTNEKILTLANVPGLDEEWSSTTTLGPSVTAPIVVGSRVFVASSTGLAAFDAGGVEGCSGSPKTCAPLWTAPGFANNLFVLGGVLVRSGGSGIEAFDPAGATNCSGAPRVCQPLWTSPNPAGAGVAAGSEIFAPGQIGSGTAVVTAAGCAAPASCPPLRTYPAPCASLSLCTSKYTSLAGDDLITSSDGHLTENTGMVAAFDRSGAQGCSGTPITCAPRWATRVGDPIGPPAVAGGSIYQAALEWCSVPEECAPRATLTALDRATGAKRWVNPLSTSFAGIAVADGWVHEAHSDELVTYRDPGTCITTCPRHHRAALGGTGRASLAVANGMVFVGNSNGVSVFDVAGVAGCTPAPIECSAVAHVDGFWTYELSIALGNVWAVDSTGRLHALGLD